MRYVYSNERDVDFYSHIPPPMSATSSLRKLSNSLLVYGKLLGQAAVEEDASDMCSAGAGCGSSKSSSHSKHKNWNTKIYTFVLEIPLN